MGIKSSLAAASLAVVAAALAADASAALYRYVDANGRVVYSDQPPPPSAKGVEPKEFSDNVIETDPIPLAAQEAAKNFPVTFYTWDCDICRDARALLTKRGVPFETVIVTGEQGAARLKALTGNQTGPVLQIGEKVRVKLATYPCRARSFSYSAAIAPVASSSLIVSR